MLRKAKTPAADRQMHPILGEVFRIGIREVSNTQTRSIVRGKAFTNSGTAKAHVAIADRARSSRDAAPLMIEDGRVSEGSSNSGSLSASSSDSSSSSGKKKKSKKSKKEKKAKKDKKRKGKKDKKEKRRRDRHEERSTTRTLNLTCEWCITISA